MRWIDSADGSRMENTPLIVLEDLYHQSQIDRALDRLLADLEALDCPSKPEEELERWDGLE